MHRFASVCLSVCLSVWLDQNSTLENNSYLRMYSGHGWHWGRYDTNCWSKNYANIPKTMWALFYKGMRLTQTLPKYYNKPHFKPGYFWCACHPWPYLRYSALACGLTSTSGCLHLDFIMWRMFTILGGVVCATLVAFLVSMALVIIVRKCKQRREEHVR